MLAEGLAGAPICAGLLCPALDVRLLAVQLKSVWQAVAAHASGVMHSCLPHTAAGLPSCVPIECDMLY